MTLHSNSRTDTSLYMSTQEKNHTEALQRAEALLKKLEQRLDKRTEGEREENIAVKLQKPDTSKSRKIKDQQLLNSTH